MAEKTRADAPKRVGATYSIQKQPSKAASNAKASEQVPAASAGVEPSREELLKEVARLQAAVSRLQNAVQHDESTGLLNRRAFVERAKAEFLRSRRYEREMALTIVNLMGFNRIAEEHGEQAGEHLAMAIAQMCTTASRAGSDIIGRISPRQIAILLPEIGMAGVRSFTGRMKSQLASHPIEWNGVRLRSGLKLSSGVLLPEDKEFADFYKRTFAQRLPNKVGENA